jgi:hypothetical protein
MSGMLLCSLARIRGSRIALARRVLSCRASNGGSADRRGKPGATIRDSRRRSGRARGLDAFTQTAKSWFNAPSE